MSRRTDSVWNISGEQRFLLSLAVCGSIVVLATEMARPAPPSATAPADREAQIAKALELCGDGVALEGRATTATIANNAVRLARASLAGMDLSVGWPMAAKKVAARYAGAWLTIRTSRQPAHSSIRSILGQEDSPEADDQASVTWYKYGWCHFGVADGKVMVLRADCSMVAGARTAARLPTSRGAGASRRLQRSPVEPADMPAAQAAVLPSTRFVDCDPAARLCRQKTVLSMFCPGGQGSTVFSFPDMETKTRAARASFRPKDVIDAAINSHPYLLAAVSRLSRDMAGRWGNVEFTIVGCSGPAWEEALAVLGVEESARGQDTYDYARRDITDNTAGAVTVQRAVRVTWRKYGWLTLGEGGGQLLCVRVSAADMLAAEQNAQEYEARTANVRRTGSGRPAAPPKQLVLGNGMEFVLIPAGQFQMGTPRSTRSPVNPDEMPQHTVTISKPFYMAIHQVKGRARDRGAELVGGMVRSRIDEAGAPLTVTWEDAMELCARLARSTGRIVRLPTEAEWEYACRAGTTTRFYFGDKEEDLENYAWYKKNCNDRMHPVGLKKPNAWGLYDMYGNAWQWCSDWYSADYYARSKPVDPQGPERESPSVRSYNYAHVMRGGNAYCEASSCRSARRNGVRPTHGPAIECGVRLVVEVAPTDQTEAAPREPVASQPGAGATTRSTARKAEERSPEQRASSMLQLAEVYRQAGREEKAIQILRDLMITFPATQSAQTAKDMLAKLESKPSP